MCTICCNGSAPEVSTTTIIPCGTGDWSSERVEVPVMVVASPVVRSRAGICAPSGSVVGPSGIKLDHACIAVPNISEMTF